MAIQLRDWFFQQLPRNIQKTDTFVNLAGEGLLQRYLRIFGTSLDNDFIPFIDNFSNIFDYEKCDDKFLPLLSGIVGYPPNIDGTTETYRKIIGYAIAIYRVKGTLQSFEIAFNLLGLEISIIEEIPTKAVLYDAANSAYDDGPPELYDTLCAYCSGYKIAYNSELDTTDPWVYNTISTTVLNNIPNIINWLSPINAQFNGIVRRIKIRDGFTLTATDSYTITHE